MGLLKSRLALEIAGSLASLLLGFLLSNWWHARSMAAHTFEAACAAQPELPAIDRWLAEVADLEARPPSVGPRAPLLFKLALEPDALPLPLQQVILNMEDLSGRLMVTRAYMGDTSRNQMTLRAEFDVLHSEASEAATRVKTEINRLCPE